MPLRPSGQHWIEIRELLRAVESCVEFCARFDAHRPTGRPIRGGARVFQRIDELRGQVGREVDRTTAERLQLDLREKIAASRAA